MDHDPLNITDYKCKKCPLWRQRTNIVWGSGTYDSPIAFIGEAPGYHEDQQGKAFVGASGNILNKALKLVSKLEGVDLTRKNVLILNTVKCRPPHNRTPKHEEMEMCSMYLLPQLMASNAQVIMTLGQSSWSFITGIKTSMVSETTGYDIKLQWRQKYRYFWTFHNMHPAYICRNQAMLPLFVKNIRIACRKIIWQN